MAEFILEIGLEEMPAAYINGAVSDLKKNAEALFKKERLNYDAMNCYSTPRRLVLFSRKFGRSPRRPFRRIERAICEGCL